MRVLVYLLTITLTQGQIFQQSACLDDREFLRVSHLLSTQPEAKISCVDNFNASLARMDSPEKYNFVLETYRPSISGLNLNLWIGVEDFHKVPASSANDTLRFSYIDGSIESLDFFKEPRQLPWVSDNPEGGQADEYCVAMTVALNEGPQDGWFDLQCNRDSLKGTVFISGYICERQCPSPTVSPSNFAPTISPSLSQGPDIFLEPLYFGVAIIFLAFLFLFICICMSITKGRLEKYRLGPSDYKLAQPEVEETTIGFSVESVREKLGDENASIQSSVGWNTDSDPSNGVSSEPSTEILSSTL